jgi:hypothetical protein
MRGLTAALYFAALGWYVRWSGLDVRMVTLARDCYDLAVLHTARTLRDLEFPDPANRELP